MENDKIYYRNFNIELFNKIRNYKFDDDGSFTLYYIEDDMNVL